MKSCLFKIFTHLFLLVLLSTTNGLLAKDYQIASIFEEEAFYSINKHARKKKKSLIQASPYGIKRQSVPISSHSRDIFSKPSFISSLEWDIIKKSIRKASLRYQVPEKLIYSLVKKESGFNPRALSHSGARGLTQLMPTTAKYECGLSKNQLFEINSNINCGISYLSKQLRSFGREDLALAAYNAGPGAVKRAINQTNSTNIHSVTSVLKAETRPYVKNILAYVDQY